MPSNDKVDSDQYISSLMAEDRANYICLEYINEPFFCFFWTLITHANQETELEEKKERSKASQPPSAKHLKPRFFLPLKI